MQKFYFVIYLLMNLALACLDCFGINVVTWVVVLFGAMYPKWVMLICQYWSVCINGFVCIAADFKFQSHRYRSHPFSLTLYVNGRQDCRLSVCCEYKHKAGVRLGGKSGHFGIGSVEGSSPCYRSVHTCLLFLDTFNKAVFTLPLFWN